MFRSEKWLTVIGGLMLAGCASGPTVSPPKPSETQPVEVRDPAAPDGSLKTDKASYSPNCQGEGNAMTCTFTLELTYTNQTDATIYFDHCDPDSTSPIYFVGALTEEESAYSSAWGCVGFDERVVKVEAGEQRTDTLELRGPNSWDGVTGKPFGLFGGRLQIYYEAHSCASEGDPCGLPQETATSNVFTVTLPD